MTFSVTFTIDGLPVPKGRPKFSSRGGFARVYTPKKTADYEAQVKAAAEQAMQREPLETPVSVYLYFRLPIPQSYSKTAKEGCLSGFKRHTKRPDLDNLAKSVLDALNEVVWADDSQIVSLHITKVYASAPGVDVHIAEDLP